jgi:dTDP-4-dehydrorhamnose reductase
MRVLVTGSHGLLGTSIVEVFAAQGHDVRPLDHGSLDIVDARAVRDCVARVTPDVIINCAAYNDVDAAEDNAVSALQVNALGVRGLAAAARDVDAVFVHYSTDFVFDGTATRPYTEEDAPSPQSVYGASKLLGEWFAADVRRHYVLRVESLFGPPAAGRPTRRGSLGTIVDRIRAGGPVPVFVDRTVSPSFTPDVARATARLLDIAAPAGLYHCVNDGAATWLEVAKEVAGVLGRDLQAAPLTLETVKARAVRPRFCALSPARLASLGVVMPTWQDALVRYLQA